MFTSPTLNLIQEIVAQSQTLAQEYVPNFDFSLSYCCIFAQNQEQYDQQEQEARSSGLLLSKTPTGNLYQLTQPLATSAGLLKILKVRLPDPTRPELGDCDFKLDNYLEFKNQYLSLDQFKLITRSDFEMIELMDNDFNVRVYFSYPSVEEQYRI